MVSVGVVSLVKPLGAMLRIFVEALSVILEIVGLFGALVSIFTEYGLEDPLSLPAASVALTVKLWLPEIRFAVVKVKVPAVDVSVAVPSKVVPS